MMLRTALLSLAASLTLAGAARAQTAVTLEGRCEKLVVAGRDVTATCKDTVVNAVSRNRTSFDFATRDGRSLSFTGNGAQQERTDETDALQPINLVVPGETGKEGIVRNPVVAVGSCSFRTPEAGKTAIVCEATAATGRFEGVFVTDAKDADAKNAPGTGAPKN